MTYNKSVRIDVLLIELTGKLRETGGVREADRHDEANCRLSQLCERALKLRCVYKGTNIRETTTRPLRTTSGQRTIS